MKLCRYGKSGFEKPGMIDAQGQLRDLSHVLPNIDQATLSPAGLAKLKKIKPETLPLVKGEPRLGVPYTGISKFVAIGLNYSDHAKEAGMPIPSEPVVFMKATTCISGPNDDIIQPRNSVKLDWEVELAIVIGTKAQYVSEEKALNYVAGYCIRAPARSCPTCWSRTCSRVAASMRAATRASRACSPSSGSCDSRARASLA